MNRLGITSKLTLVFVLFAGLVLVGLSIPAYNNGRAALEAATVSELLTTALEKQAALNTWVADRQHGIGDIANQTHLRETASALIAAAPGSSDAVLAHAGLVKDLGNWASEGHRFLAMEVIEAATGRVIAATDAGAEGKFREEQPYFLDGLQAPYVQNPYFDLSRGRPGMTAAAPVLSPEGKMIAVLAGPLNMDEMNAIIQRRSGLHRTDDAYLVNTSNLFVTQPRLNPDPAILQRGVHTEAVNRCLAHNSGVTVAPDYRDVPAFIVYRWLPERQLCLIAKIDQDEALAPSRALASTMALIGGLVLLIGSIVAFGMSRTFTRPVHQLVRGAQEIGRGNLEYRIAVGARDELGQLANAFNEMAVNLRASLGQTAHGQRMLVALSQAAQAVQRAQTPEQVYQTVGDEVTRLGYHAMAFTVVDDRTHLALAHLTFSSAVIRAVEKVAGLSAQGFRFPIVPGGVHDQIITSGRTVFFEQAATPLAESLAQPLRPLAGRITSLFGVEQAIYAPLTMNGRTEGLLMVTGDGLAEADAPAITAFANQTAIALENARLYQETRAWAAELEQRVQAQTATIRASEEKYRNLFENAQVGMYRSTLDGSAILDANQKLADIFGYSIEEMRAEPATIRWADPAARAAMVDRLRANGLLNDYELDIVTKSGALKTVLTSIKLYPQEGYLEGSAIDISDRKRAEQELRVKDHAIESAHSAIAISDLAGNLTYVNPAFLSIWGYAQRPEVVGRSAVEFWQMGAKAAEVMQVLQAGQAWSGELTARRRDSTLFDVLVGASMIVDQASQPIGMMASFTDITERKLAEKIVLEEKTLSDSIINSLPGIFYLFDAQGKFLRWNRNFERVGGYSAEEMLDRNVADFFVGEEKTLVQQRIQEAFIKGAANVEAHFTSKSGAGTPYYLTGVRIELDGQPHLIGVGVDITERKRAGEQLARTAADLARSNTELERFAYVASHDLQEPLRMVTSYLQLIERRYGDRLDGDAREFMGYAVDGANRMKALINDLLAYSRVGTHGKPFGAVDCATSLAQATANLQIAITESAAVVTHDPLPVVTGDDGQLTQLFQNLIGNAIKFHGAEPPCIHVSARETFEVSETSKVLGAKVWEFSVRDNGIGMNPQYFDRIFVIFQRLHTRDDYPGTGIGLAISKRIVERHGGHIWVESTPGQGATFHFTMPVSRGQ